MKKYSRVSYRVRCQIISLLQANISVSRIATQLGFHKSTIYRELKRNQSNLQNSFKKEYHPLRAQGLMIERKKRCRRKLKIVPEIEKKIKRLLENAWSPQQISGRLKYEKITVITHQSIYRFIEYNPKYKKYLHRYGKKRFQYKRQKNRPMPGWWKSIDERPDDCTDRKRIGDWERDTMVGVNRKQALLVCTDRKSRYSKLALVNNLRSETVADATIKIINETKIPPLTMTNDNGPEFKCPDKLPIPVYYCHPYTPQERGTVENTIGIVRRFFPKRSDLKNMNLLDMENWLNHRPRKVLNYKTPFEVYYDVNVALAT